MNFITKNLSHSSLHYILVMKKSI